MCMTESSWRVTDIVALRSRVCSAGDSLAIAANMRPSHPTAVTLSLLDPV